MTRFQFSGNGIMPFLHQDIKSGVLMLDISGVLRCYDICIRVWRDPEVNSKQRSCVYEMLISESKVWYFHIVTIIEIPYLSTSFIDGNMFGHVQQ